MKEPGMLPPGSVVWNRSIIHESVGSFGRGRCRYHHRRRYPVFINIVADVAVVMFSLRFVRAGRVRATEMFPPLTTLAAKHYFHLSPLIRPALSTA
jgi:hypothetical protein